MRKASKKVALLIDAENIWYSLHNLHGRKADFGIILEKAAQQGTLSHADAYADFSRLPQAASLELFRCGIRLIHAPNWANGGREDKSTTDQVLADDAYRLFHESNAISTYVLASGDGHFVPLISAIRRRGKRTVIVAVPESANHLLVRCAEQFVSCLPEEPDGGVEVPSPAEGPINPDLVQALAQLEEENSYLTFGFVRSSSWWSSSGPSWPACPAGSSGKCSKCAVSVMCRSAEKLSGMLKIPVRTHLIPAKWLESRKGGGSVAWWGKRRKRAKLPGTSASA